MLRLTKQGLYGNLLNSFLVANACQFTILNCALIYSCVTHVQLVCYYMSRSANIALGLIWPLGKCCTPIHAIAYTYPTRWVFCCNYRIAGNFQGRKFLWISRFCGYCKSFLRKILGSGVLWCCTSEPIRKSFLHKNYQFAKVFSLESFLL